MASKHTHIIEARSKGFKKAAKESNKLKGSLTSLQKSVMGLAGAYLGAAGLIEGVRSSVTAYAQQQAAERQLAQALGTTSQALLDQASALQNLSLEGDEAIIMQQAFLASIGMTEDQIKRIIPVALDLSAATGITLESAVRNTAKTFSGLAGELGELVPQIRDLSPEAMKAGRAVDVMGELFAGQATSAADTLQGKMVRVREIVGDVLEDIGEKLSPSIESLADAVLYMAGAVEEDDSLEGRIKAIDAAIESTKNLMVIDDKAMRVTNAKRLQDLENRKKQLEEDKKRRAELQLSHNEMISNINEEISLEEAQFQTSSEKRSARIEFNKKLRESNEESFNEQFKRTIELARLEDVSMKAKKAMSKIQKQINADNVASTIQGFKEIGKAVGADSKTMEALTIAQALADTYAGANKAFAQGGVLGFVQGAAIVAAGLKNVQTIKESYSKKQAQTGFEGVVDEPTQFTVGEGGAAEYVSVTPLEGVNNAGGQGMTINISGNVMSDQFVEEELAERIQEAVRKGVDFGMS